MKTKKEIIEIIPANTFVPAENMVKFLDNLDLILKEKGSFNIGPVSFTEEGIMAFVQIPKEKQEEKIYNSLKPKDMEYAKRLLKDIPTTHNLFLEDGNISSGNGEAVTEDNALDATGGSGGHNPDEPKGTKAGKGKRVPKGGESGQK